MYTLRDILHLEPFHIHSLQEFHAKATRLLCDTLREFLSADAFGEAGEVVESDRDTRLSAQTGTFARIPRDA
jgi:hypothetical protein